MTVCLLENHQAPVVTSALCYRVGARHEPPGLWGIAHFLEHMMFKGGARFGPGEIDRRTQLLGGSNNAFTTHDATAYYFSFASDRWRLALDIEADRMAGLTLDPREVDAERDVILEELAMVRDDPWDALGEAVRERFHGPHPYGRSVLGDPAALAATGADELAAFHRRFYRPSNAVLVVAGDLDDGVLGDVESLWGAPTVAPGEMTTTAAASTPDGLERLERWRGDVPRMLLALPGVAATDSAYPALRMLSVLLGSGRTSRLHHALVDAGSLCSGVAVDISETVEPGMWSVSAELVPGVSPRRVEERVMAELERARRQPFTAEELERGRRILLADWVFGHERVHQQALTMAWSAALFDPGFPARQMEEAVACDAVTLQEAARRFLDPERSGVIGWSLPRRTRS